jgi:tetratricopeptide (TPR) repeat protein
VPGYIAPLLFFTLSLFASGDVFGQTPELNALRARSLELMHQRKYPEAIEVAEKAIRLAEQIFGKNHPNLVKPLRDLAWLYELQGRASDAEARYRRAIAISESQPDSSRADAIEAMTRLGSLYAKQGRHAEAAQIAERARVIAQKSAAEQLNALYHRKKAEEETAQGRMQDQTRGLRAHESAKKVSEAPRPPAASFSVGAGTGRGGSGGGSAPAAAPLLPPAQVLPSFPWPPPASSASYVFPPKVFAQLSTVGEVTSVILSALELSGYVERSFFQTGPGGVALVTRLERISGDGTPAATSDRWPLGFKVNPSDLAGFLRGLFYVMPGHYRVIVFILQDIPFTQSSTPVSGDDAKAWLREGANMLPRDIANRSFQSGTCTALIYEFESDGAAAKLVESSVTGKQHLEKAGLLAALGNVN